MLGQCLLGDRHFLALILFFLGFDLDLLVQIGDNGFDLVAEQVFLALIGDELDSDDFAQVAHQSRLVVDCGETSQLLLFSWELVAELDFGDLLDFVVNLARCQTHEARWEQSVEAVGEDGLGEELVNFELLERVAHSMILVFEQNLRNLRLLGSLALLGGLSLVGLLILFSF